MAVGFLFAVDSICG